MRKVAYNRRWVEPVHCVQRCLSTRWRRHIGTVRSPTSCSLTVYAGHWRPGSVGWCWSVYGHSMSSRTWWTGGWTRHSAAGRLHPPRPPDWPVQGQSRSCLDCRSSHSTLCIQPTLHIHTQPESRGVYSPNDHGAIFPNFLRLPLSAPFPPLFALCPSPSPSLLSHSIPSMGRSDRF